MRDVVVQGEHESDSADRLSVAHLLSDSSGVLEVEATAAGTDNSLTTIVELVEQAQAEKGDRARLADRELGLEVSDTALDRLAELGFDPVYGARPLKRAVQRELENPLAQGILSGEFKTGDCIVIDLEGENFSFRSPVVSEAQVA